MPPAALNPEFGARAPKVVFFHRKPYPSGHYSLESIFADVRQRIADAVDSRVVESRYFSRGLFRRILNAIEAAFRQGDVNLVTGDVNYICLALRGKRTLLVIPDCGPLHDSTGLSRLVQKWFWVTLPVQHVARVITISEFARQEIVHFSRCSPDKVVVIPVAVNDRYSYVARPFHLDRPVLLQVGQAPNKNQARIIEAIRGLEVRLVTVGELAAADAGAIETNGIDHVNHRRLSDDEMVRAYIDSDALVFPSTYEGFGMPILEAQAVGRPVITSTVASMPWVAGDAACFVDPFSVGSIRAGILKVISNGEYRAALVAKGLENVKRFPAAQMPRLYLDEILRVYGASGWR